MKETDFYPGEPVISRYSAPWDADGWYYVGENFGKNSIVYSNTDVKAEKVPKCLLGGDFIVTYNSASEGKADNQESDFFLECDAWVYTAFTEEICINGNAPDWLSEFTEDKETVTAGRKKYRLFRKLFKKGSHVIIPAFEGNYDNYFVVAKAVSVAEPGDIASRAARFSEREEHKNKGTPAFYISECFKSDGWEESFNIAGDVRRDTGKNVILLSEGASAEPKNVPEDGNIFIRAELTVISGKCTFGDVVFDGGKISFYGTEAGVYENGKPVSVRISADTDSGASYLFVNHRLASVTDDSVKCRISASLKCESGCVCMDYIQVCDSGERYILKEDFETRPFVSMGGKAKSEIVPFPFEKNQSLKISSEEGGTGALDFKKSSGIITVQTRVFAAGSGCAMIRISDSEGGTAAIVSLYKNNIFVSNGDSWERVLGEVTPYCYYPSGNWYDIRIILDTKRGIFTLWVDGAERASKKRFCEKISYVSRAEYFCNCSNLYINRLYVYEGKSLCGGIRADKVFNVKKYGAKGNGKTLDTKAIQAAVDDASAVGGTVLLSDGTFLTGEIFLKSDITFFIDTDAVLLGTQEHSEYPLMEPGISLCAHRQLGRAVLYGENVHNVTVTGGGMIDGNGKYRFKENDPAPDRRNEDARPDCIYIAYSDEINIENINFRRSAFWTVVPLSSRNITLKNLCLDCMNTPNRDGIDPVDCSDMTVSGCDILAGDDGLCFKSSDTVGCRNIEVHDMLISSLASAVKFGTDTYFGLENAKFSDCFIKNVNRCAVSLESVDGALVRDLCFERFDITDASAPFYVCTGNRNRLPKGIHEERTSKIDGVIFKDTVFRSPRTHGHPLPIYESMIIGQSHEQSIDNLTIENLTVEMMGGVGDASKIAVPEPIGKKYPEYDRHGLSAGSVVTARYTKGLKIVNLNIAKRLKKDARQPIALFDSMK